MITTMFDALRACDEYRDSEGFCTRNCSCSGLSFGGTLTQHHLAEVEATAAGIDRYDLMCGKCGDWYVIPLNHEGGLA